MQFLSLTPFVFEFFFHSIRNLEQKSFRQKSTQETNFEISEMLIFDYFFAVFWWNKKSEREQTTLNVCEKFAVALWRSFLLGFVLRSQT